MINTPIERFLVVDDIRGYQIANDRNGVEVVLASDHDAAVAERDARIAELERFRSVDAGVEVLLRHRIEALEALEAGLSAFVAKLDVIHNDPRYKALWVLTANRGMPYTGPNYETELADIRALLATTHNQS